MVGSAGGAKYVPGTYVKPTPSAAQISDRYIREWELKWREKERKKPKAKMPPAICFSRKIGVGVLEIAGILAEKIGYRVIDRQILENIADEAKLSERTVSLFDERYPGKLNEFVALAFGEKAFIESDYSRHLFKALISIAGMGPTIFLGRGAHLLLPRDRVLAVRFISSRPYRVKRLARILQIAENEAERRVDLADREQRDFFKKVYDKKDASPYEFDMVINCDWISNPEVAAAIVAQAAEAKFGPESEEDS